MKKFWNLMLVALVMMGAVACTESDESLDVKQEAGLSFYAEIANDNTRAYIEKDENYETNKTWNTIWEEGDELTAYDQDANPKVYFTFECVDAATGKFTCTQEGVSNLLGKKVVIFVNDPDANVNSAIGKKALDVCTIVDNFSADAKISLTSQISFFRYTYNGTGEVALTVTSTEDERLGGGVFRKDDGMFTATNTMTFSGITGENFVAFWCGGVNVAATLSYSIDGVKCKEAELTLNEGKVYNLGTLTEPEPSAKVYLVPNVWDVDSAWFTAYFFDAKGNNCPVTMTASAKEGVYEASVPAGMEKVIFCRMNPAFTEFGWNTGEEAEGDPLHVWNQSTDLEIGVEPDNYYYIHDWSVGVWGTESGYELPETPAIVWALAGTFNSWGDLIMTSTDAANVFVAKGVELAAGAEIKVKDSTTWDTSFGAGISYLEANKWMTVYQGSNTNVTIAKSATYDVYFEYLGNDSKLYLMEVDATYTNATEQTANGEVETPEEVTPGVTSEWALVGAFSGWADKYFVTTTNANVVVLTNVEMKAAEGFLVRKPSTDWVDKYGAGVVNYLKTNHYITTVKGGADMCLEADGTYDVYFNISSKNIYIMTAGTDYTTATEQTVNGEEPKQKEPEVTDKVVYLKPNSNWTESNARFAAYFWNNSGNVWVSMTAVGDGTYQVNLPEGYDYGCNVIFCRMNPSTTANNWNNKWNQTSDLKTPTDGKNLYTVKDDTWDKGGGTWSVK